MPVPCMIFSTGAVGLQDCVGGHRLMLQWCATALTAFECHDLLGAWPVHVGFGNSRLLRGVMILVKYAVHDEPLRALIANLPDVPLDGCETMCLESR